MLLKFSRRFNSTLVKAEASAILNNTVDTQSGRFEINEYETANLQDYFKSNGIMFPLETLIEKYQEKDYKFFLEQKNFYKVADSLEKFETCLDAAAVDDFVTFKRKLYTTYEVQNRSTLEHTLYSSEIDNYSIHHMKESNANHIA